MNKEDQKQQFLNLLQEKMDTNLPDSYSVMAWRASVLGLLRRYYPPTGALIQNFKILSFQDSHGRLHDNDLKSGLKDIIKELEAVGLPQQPEESSAAKQSQQQNIQTQKLLEAHLNPLQLQELKEILRESDQAKRESQFKAFMATAGKSVLKIIGDLIIGI